MHLRPFARLALLLIGLGSICVGVTAMATSLGALAYRATILPPMLDLEMAATHRWLGLFEVAYGVTYLVLGAIVLALAPRLVGWLGQASPVADTPRADTIPATVVIRVVGVVLLIAAITAGLYRLNQFVLWLVQSHGHYTPPVAHVAMGMAQLLVAAAILWAARRLAAPRPPITSSPRA